MGRGLPLRSLTTIVVTNFGSAARSFSKALVLGPEDRLASHHQLDQGAALGRRPLLARQVERQPNVGILCLREFEIERLFPAPFAIVQVGVLLRQGAVQLVDLAANLAPSGDLARRGDLEVGLIHVVEEGEELVILALGDRVVLVVVALGTADRQTEEDRPGRVDAIDDRIDAELFDVDPPLLVDQRIAMKAGGDARAELAAAAQRSPASCTVANRSNGMPELIAAMTQSRYFQIERGASML